MNTIFFHSNCYWFLKNVYKFEILKEFQINIDLKFKLHKKEYKISLFFMKWKILTKFDVILRKKFETKLIFFF